MDYFIRNWVLNRIGQLRAVWVPYTTDPTHPLFATATRIVRDLNGLRLQAEGAHANLASFKYNG